MLVESLEVAEFAPYDPNDTLDETPARGDVQTVRWNGILGSLYCDRTSGCSTINGNLRSGWYFTPVVRSSQQSSIGYDTTLARYQDSDNDGTWEVVGYVDYGMWLDGVDTSLALHRRVDWVGPGNPAATLDFTTVGTATYTGKASGLSARKTDVEGNDVYASGHFEADVELRATFDPLDATLEGTIDNFRSVAGSGHVDTTWSLDLQSTELSGSSDITGMISLTDGTADRNADGRWSADSYGNTGEYPTGFYGGFEVEFQVPDSDDPNQTDVIGVAAGVYEASK